MKKSLQELTLEEKMAIAIKLVKEDEFKKMPQVKRFILYSKLEQGTSHIPAVLIYDKYLSWTSAAKVSKLEEVQFFQEFKKYFQKVVKNDGVCYCLNSGPFDLSIENILQAKEKRKSRRGQKKKAVKSDVPPQDS